MTIAEYIARAAEARRCRARPLGARRNRKIPPTIHRAMRYSLFAGGKRIRPLLAIAAAEAVSDAPRGIESAACSLELIHTYSLIHDDLPALDNDDLRRGRPTCHKVFGDAMAILAGDALLTLASRFWRSSKASTPSGASRWCAELATASGTVGGMIGGQVNDIEGEGKLPTAHLLESIHRAKTGALLRASVRMGGDLRGRRRLAARRADAASASTSAWRFRSSTTCSMWSNPPRRSAKPPARMRSRRRSRFRRSTGSNDRARWRSRSAWPRTSR